MRHRVLIVTTSTGRAGSDGIETGFDWISMATPYWRLREAGVTIVFASIRGGKPPGDPETARDPETGSRAGSVNMFLGDGAAVEALAHSHSIGRVDPAEWDAVLITDGLGGLWDLVQSEALATVIAEMWTRGALVATLGTGTAALAHVKIEGGRSLVPGMRLTCLADRDVTARIAEPPVRPESLLREKGANLIIGAEGESAAMIEEGRLITGQDARAAAELALQLLDALEVNGQRARVPDDTDPAPTAGALDPQDSG